MYPLPDFKLITLVLYCQRNNSLRCPNCGQRHFIRWGTYLRKAIHFASQVLYIQRFKCREKGCKSTFSMRPLPVLPICRFSLWHLLQVDEWLKTGAQTLHIAKSLGLNHRIIQRIKRYLARVRPFVFQELRLLNPDYLLTFFSQWITLIKSSSWFELTRKYFQALYPLRVIHPLTNTK